MLLVLTACEEPASVQHGYRGTGMLQIYKPTALAMAAPIHEIPEPEPVDPPEPDAQSLNELYENVQVLNDLSALEFSRLMAAMTTWVAPEEGCKFCHNTKNLASDEKYTKVVSRRMLQMTRNLNNQWKTHVKETGVTCWTCHRGQAVPSGDWFNNPGLPHSQGNMLGDKAGQNTPTMSEVANSSLPFNPLSTYLVNGDYNIRVQGTQTLAGENRRSIKQAEHTYGLMMYMSTSLGVNCTYCHNTRAMGDWNVSTPQRVTAWYGIRMVRDINTNYLTELAQLFPPYRLSEEGDFPKVGCATCHKGAYKPLYGVSMLPDYPELAKDIVYEISTVPANIAAAQKKP
jgi:photosynthetic reaction center cytochrome c subunit